MNCIPCILEFPGLFEAILQGGVLSIWLLHDLPKGVRKERGVKPLVEPEIQRSPC